MTITLTTGEKRSITISLKKVMEKYQSMTFPSVTKCVTFLYQHWVDESKKEKVAWCFDKKIGWKQYEENESFQLEAKDKIQHLLNDYSFSFQPIQPVRKEHHHRPIRSKKKRIRKKYALA